MAGESGGSTPEAAGLHALRAAVEAALAAQARRVETVVGAARRALEQAAQDQATTVDELAQQITARLTGATASHDDVLDAVRLVVGDAAAPVETMTGALEDVHARIRDLVDAATEDRRTVRALVERVGALSARVEEGLGEVADAARRQREQWDEAFAAARDQVREDTDALRDQLRSSIRVLGQELRDAVDVAGERFAEDARREAALLRETTQESSLAATERLQAVVDGLVIRLGATEQRLDAAVDALGTAEDTLARDLAERRQQATVERAALTLAFAEQLVDGLSRRERRRLARHLEVPDLDAAAPPAPVPATPPPSEDKGPVPPAATPPAGGEAGDSRRRRVVPPRPARPVRAGASAPQDPAAMRRTLAAVRGLGPARQSALIDAFGSLEALREASDDDLLAVTGIGPSLVRPIRDAVG